VQPPAQSDKDDATLRNSAFELKPVWQFRVYGRCRWTNSRDAGKEECQCGSAVIKAFPNLSKKTESKRKA
jgi:hypothetical protein